MSSVEVKPDRWARLRGLSWWELVLAFAPVALVFLGGIIGGVFGGIGVMANLTIARSNLNSAIKALVMVLVCGAAAVAYLVVAAVFFAVLK